MSTTKDPVARLRDAIGVTRGPSPWRTVEQSGIDAFANVSGDHQWIHVDMERAKRESPFGTTIAHGDMTLCTIGGLLEQIPPIDEEELELGVNVGWNRVRYVSPVPVGSRVRLTGELVSIVDKGSGWWEIVDRYTVELEGSEKPACVAENVSRLLFKDR